MDIRFLQQPFRLIVPILSVKSRERRRDCRLGCRWAVPMINTPSVRRYSETCFAQSSVSVFQSLMFFACFCVAQPPSMAVLKHLLKIAVPFTALHHCISQVLITTATLFCTLSAREWCALEPLSPLACSRLWSYNNNHAAIQP